MPGKRKIFIGAAIALLMIAAAIAAWSYRSGDEPSKNYIEGKISISLKPYTDRKILESFIAMYPEISLSDDPYSPLTFGASAQISLEPYDEWQKRIISPDDSQIADLAANGEKELTSIYNGIKDSPLLRDSTFKETHYSRYDPKYNELPIILLYFKEGTSQKDYDNFLSQLGDDPKLEVINKEEEVSFYGIEVPSGKEQYWAEEFAKQDFIRAAGLEPVFHID